MVLALGSCGADAAERCARIAHDSRYQQIEALIKAEFAKSPDSALTIGIVEHACLTWSGNYGKVTTPGSTNAAPPSDTAIYPVASITKLFTGLMLLQLVDRGVVHMTDPVDEFVPEIRAVPNPYPWAPPITLIQLATMTSGFDGNYSEGIPDAFPSEDADPATWDQRLAKQISNSVYGFEPGTQRRYSNGGYAILGLALSRAAHRPYAEYVKTEILEPLGMKDSSFSIGSDAVSRFAYAPKGMPLLPSWEKHTAIPAGGLFSTLNDMVKFMRFQFGLGPERVLSHKALEGSFQLVVPSDGDLRYGDSVGFAAVRESDGKLVALGHGGETWDYIASYEYDRSKQSGIIVLTSHRTNDYKPLVRKGLQILNLESNGGTGLKPNEEH